MRNIDLSKPLTAPPDREPRKPKIVCPPGAWDCHIHIYGPSDRFKFDELCPYSSEDTLAEDYIRLQEILGLSKAVLVNGAGYGLNTEHLRYTLARFPDRFKGVCYMAPDIAPAEVRELQALGVCAARFVAGPAWPHLPTLDEQLARRLHDEGMHIELFNFAVGAMAQVKDRLLGLPNTVVLDHFGMPDTTKGLDDPGFRVLLELLDSGRVWIKLSRPMNAPPHRFPYPEMTKYARALVAHAPERLVWGSDWPHVVVDAATMPNDGDLLDLMLDWVPDIKTRNRILAENPSQLYGGQHSASAGGLRAEASRT